MNENEEKKNTAAELPDEALDMVAGGSGGDHVCHGYCPYCGRNHHLCRLGVQTMPSGMIAEAYECAKGLFYKVDNIYFDRSGRPIH